MGLSIVTYAFFSGACGFADSAWQVGLLRFFGALGMGGEWSLGVALVMELWPNKSRGFLAGLIGAAGNVGYLLIASLGLGLSQVLGEVHQGLLALGLSESWGQSLVAHSGWRLLMLLGAAPALLTLFIQFFVPESERWRQEKARGSTSHWETRDLIGVAVGVLGPAAMIYVRVADFGAAVQAVGTLLALLVVTVGYSYPVIRYLQRSMPADGMPAHDLVPTLRRMFLGACLGGVALLGTWGSMQWAPAWADQLTGGSVPEAKAYTQMCGATGAIVGTMLGALMGDWLGRRLAYTILCLTSLASALVFFQLNKAYGTPFLASVFVAGACTASFYGWLPLYLPELFPTRLRATGQGFSYNFGRILAAAGTLQVSTLMGVPPSYPTACSMISLIYILGMALIWLAPETRGRPLPE
jgi:MFS family permease